MVATSSIQSYLAANLYEDRGYFNGILYSILFGVYAISIPLAIFYPKVVIFIQSAICVILAVFALGVLSVSLDNFLSFFWYMAPVSGPVFFIFQRVKQV